MKNLSDNEIVKQYELLLTNGINCWASSVGKNLLEKEIKRRGIEHPLID
jgi:hypothetical protein